MIELEGDMWEIPCDVRCVLTNGTVTDLGNNIMGGGVALEARNRYPNLPYVYGQLIEAHGHHVYLVYPHLVCFPTKEEIEDDATFDCIRRSLKELVVLTGIYGWEKVALPRPGCGLGGLNWDDVQYLCEQFLQTDHFIIVNK